MSQHERLLEALQATGTFDAPECEPSERRTHAQRQADAFVDVIDVALKSTALPTARGQKPHITVTVPLDTLTGGGDQPGVTRYGTQLSAEAVRRIACDAALTRVVLNATSMVLDVGRETREWTVAQYRAAEATFGGCAFPVQDGEMCGRPPLWCDLHHIRYWRNGGHTDQRNGALVCSHHHDLIHHGRWTLTYDHEGQSISVATTREDGSTCRRSVDLARPIAPGAESRAPATVPPALAGADPARGNRSPKGMDGAGRDGRGVGPEAARLPL